MATHLHSYTQAVKDHEAELKRYQDHRTQLHEEISDLKSRESHHVADAAQTRSRLEDARRDIKALETQIAQLQVELSKERDALDREKRGNREVVDKLQHRLANHDTIITRLKAELKKCDEDLEERDESYALKVILIFAFFLFGYDGI